ncbi:hypothetical protein ACFLY0_02380, partial [Patescibacteria group bacterium]
IVTPGSIIYGQLNFAPPVRSILPQAKGFFSVSSDLACAVFIYIFKSVLLLLYSEFTLCKLVEFVTDIDTGATKNTTNKTAGISFLEIEYKIVFLYENTRDKYSILFNFTTKTPNCVCKLGG